jgi:GGDEF domain-containing protein
MIRFASRGVKPDLTPRPRPAMLYPMRANAIPVLLMCGISAYAGIFRLMLYFLARDRKENLNFALTCLSIALYDAMCVGLYNAQSVSSGVLWQRGQFIAIAVLAFNFANFVLALFEKKSSPFKRPFFVLLATTALAGLAFPELVVSAKDPNLREFGILGLRVTYFEGHVALLMNLLNGLLALAMVYVVAIAVPYVKDHGRKELPYLAIGIGIFFVSLTLDILIASDLLVFLYTSEYSFLILVVLMDFAVQRRYVGLLREVESLNAGLEEKVERRTKEIGRLVGELSSKNEELLEKNLILAELADRDGLTKLLNHAAFHRRLVEQLGAARRQRFPVALAMIDLDRFKEINDSYGHQAGDKVILKAAEVLMGDSRDYDAKGRYAETREVAGIRVYDVPGRYGGDEFALILPYCGPKEARIVCERIRERISRIDIPGFPALRVGASLGAAVFDPSSGPERDGDELVREADRALYDAKAAGRGRTVVAGPEA